MKKRFAASLLIGAGLLASVFGQTSLKQKLTHKKALNLAVAKEVAAESEAADVCDLTGQRA